MALSRLVLSRRYCPIKVSWAALFLKAFALLAKEYPVFRRIYLDYPLPKLYEFPYSVAAITVERLIDAEESVFTFLIRRPEDMALVELQKSIDEFQHAPVESFPEIKRALRIAALPQWLRRLFLWIPVSWSVNKRVRYLGTYFLSVYSGLGAESLHPITPVTATVNYGVIAEDGTVPVRIIYDHRVTDGATVARGLNRLEKILTGEICEELDRVRVEQSLAS
jgi:hypothetical protein